MHMFYSYKSTLISWARIVGRLCTMRLIFRNATYCISGSAESKVTRGGAIFLQRFLTTSVLVISSICWRIIWKAQNYGVLISQLIEDNTDAKLWMEMKSHLNSWKYNSAISMLKSWRNSFHNIFCFTCIRCLVSGESVKYKNLTPPDMEHFQNEMGRTSFPGKIQQKLTDARLVTLLKL